MIKLELSVSYNYFLQGGSIDATIKNNLLKCYEGKFVEGEYYFITKFEVTRSYRYVRFSNSDFHLYFKKETKYIHCKAKRYMSIFCFTPFDKVSDGSVYMRLCDIGMLSILLVVS